MITLEDMYELYNYADDNTAMWQKKVAEVRIKAETVIDKMLDWFCINKMKVNNDIQYILFNRNWLSNYETCENRKLWS